MSRERTNNQQKEKQRSEQHQLLQNLQLNTNDNSQYESNLEDNLWQRNFSSPNIETKDSSKNQPMSTQLHENCDCQDWSTDALSYRKRSHTESFSPYSHEPTRFPNSFGLDVTRLLNF